MPQLSDLETKYLSSSGGNIYRGNTQVLPIVDGVDYFNAIYDTITLTGVQGDRIFILGWKFDPDMDLHGRASGTPGYKAIAELLAEKAAAGVDVRVILNGGIYLHYSSAIGIVKRNPFSMNLDAAGRMRNWPVPGTTTPPLRDRVLVDFSGAPSGSHHQKACLIKTGNDIVAFVSGMDFTPKVVDKRPHNGKTWVDGTPWGWHDITIQLRGEAVKAVWENFRSRWKEVATLPPYDFVRGPTSGVWVPQYEPLNPEPVIPAPPAAPAMPTMNSSQSVQVMRSRFPCKLYNPINPLIPGLPWDEPPTGAIYEIFSTLTKAINRAEKYIYIEDQYLADSWMPEEGGEEFSLFRFLLDAANSRGVKLIFVGSGKNDPEDFPTKILNQSFEEAGEIKKKIVDQLPWDRLYNIAVWRLKDITVHSKLMIIDDNFAAIGSANMHNRSMSGVDSELHVAFVDDTGLVRELRKNLWAEHLVLDLSLSSIDAALEDLSTGLGIWRQQWLSSTNIGMWITADNPSGYTPTATPLEFVGPGEWL